jgi:hypothetical protein
MLMNSSHPIRSAASWIGGGIALAVASYAAYAGIAWLRYGHAQQPPGPEETDALLDRFIPTYEVSERHHVRVAAPADVTLAAARDMDLLNAALARWIFKGRELFLGSRPDDRQRPRELLPLVKSLGWGMLADVPGREVVVGAITKPWEANVVFRSLPPDEFAAFHEPGWVKIVWTLRADPVGSHESVFRTETRVATTDGASRARFRRYWAFVSAGIVLIRWTMLGPLKADAERRVRAAKLALQAAVGA